MSDRETLIRAALILEQNAGYDGDECCHVAARLREMAHGPELTDTARAALLWVLWHHQGASSSVGQPIRFALGMGQHDQMTDYQIAQAKRWAEAIPVARLREIAETDQSERIDELESGREALCTRIGQLEAERERLLDALRRAPQPQKNNGAYAYAYADADYHAWHYMTCKPMIREMVRLTDAALKDNDDV